MSVRDELMTRLRRAGINADSSAIDDLDEDACRDVLHSVDSREAVASAAYSQRDWTESGIANIRP